MNAPVDCTGLPTNFANHCWHTEGEFDKDRVCCYCGARQHLKDVIGSPKNHGPHAPPVFAQEWTDVPEEPPND